AATLARPVFSRSLVSPWSLVPCPGSLVPGPLSRVPRPSSRVPRSRVRCREFGVHRSLHQNVWWSLDGGPPLKVSEGTRDQGRGTRDSGRGTRDEGLGTRDKGPGTDSLQDLRFVSRLGAIVRALIPDVGGGDRADRRMVPGLAHQIATRVGEAPLADVDREAEPGDQGTARQVRLLLVA